MDNEITTLTLATASLVMSIWALWRTLQMSDQERKEYEYYLQECRVKVGGDISWKQKLSAWNGAKGGPSPKWHWIKPVMWPFGN